MTEVVVTVEMQFAPASSEEVLGHLRRLMVESRAETDCLRFDVYEDPWVPARYFIFERWTSAEAFRVHGQKAHVVEFRNAVEPMIDGLPSRLVMSINDQHVAI